MTAIPAARRDRGELGTPTVPPWWDAAEGTWIVLDARHRRLVLGDGARFSAEVAGAPNTVALPDSVARVHRIVDALPLQRTLRSYVPVLRPVAAALRSDLADLADGDVAAAVERLDRDFAAPFSQAVLAHVGGIPAAANAQVRAWHEALVSLTDPATPAVPRRHAAAAAGDYQHWLAEMLSVRDRFPRADLFSDVMVSGPPTVPLPVATRFAQQFVRATLGTLRSTIVGTTQRLLDGTRPVPLAVALADTLRSLERPGTFVRRVTTPVRLGGRRLEVDELVLAAPGAGRFGDDTFAAAEAFRPAAAQVSHHLAAAHGCDALLGARLSRVFVPVAIEALLADGERDVMTREPA